MRSNSSSTCSSVVPVRNSHFLSLVTLVMEITLVGEPLLPTIPGFIFKIVKGQNTNFFRVKCFLDSSQRDVPGFNRGGWTVSAAGRESSYSSLNPSILRFT